MTELLATRAAQTDRSVATVAFSSVAVVSNLAKIRSRLRRVALTNEYRVRVVSFFPRVSHTTPTTTTVGVHHAKRGG